MTYSFPLTTVCHGFTLFTMTIKEAKAIVKSLGFGLRLIRNSDTNEYIVRYGNSTFLQVCTCGCNDYFTDSLIDAVDTAKAISANLSLAYKGKLENYTGKQ
jgi:hypothetical protein